MKTLHQKEWIAVVAGILLVGFFFVFGPGLLSLFQTNNVETPIQPQVGIQDETIGTGEVAEMGNRVTVHYTGTFTDGRVFDSSVSRGEPLQFVLGSGQVIEGWDKGIQGMRVGGKRMITVPPEFGYGANDYGPIPGGSTLVFEVQLLKVEK